MSNTTSFPNQSSQASFANKAEDTAKRASNEASSLANEAKAAVGDLGDRAKQGVADAAGHIRGLAEEQKSAGADRFKGYAGSIQRAADSLEDELPFVANFARKAADEIDHLADTVKNRDVSDLVGVVHDYARRQPAIFLGATALAGFLAVRFLTTSSQKHAQQAAAGNWDSERGPSPVRPAPVRPSPATGTGPAGYRPS